MKSKMPGMKEEYSEEEGKKKKPMAGIEIEIESEAEGESLASESEAEEEVSVGELAKLSDEELMAEVEKRGMVVSKPEGEEVASGGSAIMDMPEPGEEEEVVVPKKKKA
jgi:hypothetical protein